VETFLFFRFSNRAVSCRRCNHRWNAWIVRASNTPLRYACRGLRRKSPPPPHRTSAGDTCLRASRPFALGFLFLCCGRPCLQLFEQGRCRVARAIRSLIRGSGVELYAAPRGSGFCTPVVRYTPEPWSSLELGRPITGIAPFRTGLHKNSIWHRKAQPDNFNSLWGREPATGVRLPPCKALFSI
jgi:hypothetical protein